MPNNLQHTATSIACASVGNKMSFGRVLFLCATFLLLLVTQDGLAQRPYNIRDNSSNMNDPNLRTNDEGNHWAGANDSVETVDIPIGLKVWTIDENFGTRKAAVPDTLTHMFQNDAFTDGRTGHYMFTGNLGAPRISRIFTDDQLRMGGDQFIFAHPYDFFISQPSQFLFTNTKSPFTNITYHECGNKQNGEDRIRGIFSTNVNKRLGVGFKLDYLYGRGYYASQSTAHFNGTVFGSYCGDRYEMHTMYYANHLKNTENGGIDNDDYVLRPEIFPNTYAEADMPTRLDKTWNKLNVNTFYLTHRYNIGFERTTDQKGNIVKDNTSALRGKFISGAVAVSDTLGHDSIRRSSAAAPSPIALTSVADDNADDSLKFVNYFVPVISFIHTARIDHNNRRFLSNRRENAVSSDYFNDFYLPGDSANDYTAALCVSNLLAVELREGFNKWAKSGIRLFAKHAFSRYTLPDENFYRKKFVENHITLGAQLLKEQGNYFHYDLRGELRTSGSDWGEFNVEGKADFNIPLRKDTLRIDLDGYVRNVMPSFYYRHYHARNAWWDNNNLNKEFRARAGGCISYKSTSLSVHFESLQNYTCFAETQTPYTSNDGLQLARYGVAVRQASGNVQLIAATLRQDFRWGILNWENELTYQMTSDKEILPLPAFMVYSNLYLRFRIAKVLHTEFGGDVRYFTEYTSPTYSPIIGQFAIQDPASRIKVGNYPTINVYANFHLKNTRFYVMGSHVNYSSGSGNPFLLPHYPMNRLVLRLGISWNFFN